MHIAIIGSGISGLTCAYLLSRQHQVTLFEADGRIGGHTHTVDVDWQGRRYGVDTGFIVYNDWTYPNFIRLLDQLGVASRPTEMSFSVHDPASRAGIQRPHPGQPVRPPAQPAVARFLGDAAGHSQVQSRGNR